MFYNEHFTMTLGKLFEMFQKRFVLLRTIVSQIRAHNVTVVDNSFWQYLFLIDQNTIGHTEIV